MNEGDENKDCLAKWIDKIICGDAFEILLKIPDNSIDFIATDLPYNLGKYGNDPRDLDNLPYEKYVQKINEFTAQAYRILKDGHYCCILTPQESSKIGAMAEALGRAGFNENLQPIMVKEKQGYVHVLLTACKGKPEIDVKAALGIDDGVWVLTKWHEHPLKYVHPCTWSPEIPEALIKIFTKECDLVLDPFNGICTTTDVAKRLKRHFIGIDLYDWNARAEEERKKAKAKIEQILSKTANEKGDGSGSKEDETQKEKQEEIQIPDEWTTPEKVLEARLKGAEEFIKKRGWCKNGFVANY
ncbi:MAG: site-specific DNA-methyltransferase, partial [archaeon]|nr:site-specific DNA-methyltransferase [archaeon]